MKISPCLAIALFTLTLGTAFGQTPGQPATQRGPEPAAALTRFNLDFPGGTPRQLMAAIEKAMGKPVNVIVPDEFADVKLPPLKLNNVNTSELIEAINQVGRLTRTDRFGFGTPPVGAGEGAVWTFFAERRPAPAKVCRFYSLSPFLERGMTVDDITTAIQTGWKMLDEKDTPAISFHKDTKLLIAVGEERKLQTIDAALKALEVTTIAPGLEGEKKARPSVEKK